MNPLVGEPVPKSHTKYECTGAQSRGPINGESIILFYVFRRKALNFVFIIQDPKGIREKRSQKLFIGHKEVQLEEEGGPCKSGDGEGPRVGKPGVS